MKQAILSDIETVQLACPSCDEGSLRSPNGSYLVHKEQIGGLVTCDWCSEVCEVPASVFKVKMVRK